MPYRGYIIWTYATNSGWGARIYADFPASGLRSRQLLTATRGNECLGEVDAVLPRERDTYAPARALIDAIVAGATNNG